MAQHQVTVVVRVRPLDVDPSVAKDESETDNIMMIDNTHIGFVPNLSDKLNHVNQLKRLASSLATFARDSLPHQLRGVASVRSVSPRTTLKRGAFANWPTFVYDECFGPRECYDAYARTFASEGSKARTSQEEIFETIGKPATQTVLGGYHCCILAYGQTGSGKTYSMLGPCADGGIVPIPPKRSVTPLRSEPSFIGFTKRNTAARDDISQIHSLKTHPQRGLIVRITEAILEDMCVRSALDRSFCYEMSCSYYQIYKEKAWDLLADKGRGFGEVPLKLRMNERLDPYLEGLTEHTVKSMDNMLSILDLGIRNRKVASTQHNVQSSRSHAILTLNIAFGTPKETFRSKLYLVDLAGSERIGSLISGDREHNKATSAVLLSSRNKGVTRQLLKPDEQQWQEAAAAQMAEASDINSSLSALGKVINVLADLRMHRNRSAHIPYRDSLLTMVLKSCFGGNARTYMLATVSPYLRDAEESLSTLRFSSRAKLIVNKPIKNSQKARLAEMDGLRAENEQLRRQVEELELLLKSSDRGKGINQSPSRRSQSSAIWHVPEGSISRSVKSPIRQPTPSAAVTHSTEPTAVQQLFPQPLVSYAQKAPAVGDRSLIVEGDVFRAKRLLADRLEESQLYLAQMAEKETRMARLFGRPKVAVQHWDPSEEVVDSPDCLEEDFNEINKVPSGGAHTHSSRYPQTILRQRVANVPQLSKAHASPKHMNTTQPPVHTSGLIASRPTTPTTGHRYISPQRLEKPQPAPMSVQANVTDQTQLRASVHPQKRMSRRSRNKSQSKSRSRSSVSTSSDDGQQDAQIRQLLRQLELVARAQSPSARNPTHSTQPATSDVIAQFYQRHKLDGHFGEDVSSSQSTATQALSASIPAMPPAPRLRGGNLNKRW